MQRTLIPARILLLAAALLGVMLGLLLPTLGPHEPSGRLITPGYSAT